MNKQLDEEQVRKLQEKLKQMSPEEVQEIIKKQCLFCNITNGNISSNKIFEDDKCLAVLDINPATKGHTLLFPKTHFQFLNQVPEELIGHLFVVANKISEKLFEALKAEGTSIYVGNGQIAGQNVPHVMIHIIPRFEKDNVGIGWKGLKIADSEMIKLREELSAACKNIIKKKEIIEKPRVIKKVKYDERRIP